jgi:hypothetical protein
MDLAGAFIEHFKILLEWVRVADLARREPYCTGVQRVNPECQGAQGGRSGPASMRPRRRREADGEAPSPAPDPVAAARIQGGKRMARRLQ